MYLSIQPPALALPDFAQVKQQTIPSDSWLLARDGQVLQQVRINHEMRRLAWTRLEDMSPMLQQALVYSEDKRFYEHSGVDWRAVAAASWRNVWNTKTRGASTISMQLAGLLADEKHNSRRSFSQKISQTTQALVLDAQWKKDQILEAYLNLVPFRGELQGVSAMSAGLFNKSPAALDAREAALATVLIRAPNAKPDLVAKGACALLTQMQESAFCADLEGYAALKLQGPFNVNSPQLAPHLARQLINTAGQQIKSSLDADLQRFVTQQLQANLLQLNAQNVHDGAVLVLDNQTGEVLSWVGSSGKLSTSPFVDSVLSPRQAGSTLKPLLYATAFDTHILTAASLLDDSPVRINTSNGYYIPQNYDKQFLGAVSVRKALGNSLNVPAVRTLLQISQDDFFSRLKRMQFVTLTQPVDDYGYSLALGAADVRLLDLTNAYRTLANQGLYSAVTMTPKVFSDKQKRQSTVIFSPQSSFIVADIMADNNARAHTFGLDSMLDTHYWSAVKTGTSKDMRDNWCVGFSQRYTVGVWVGNGDGSPMHDVSGVTGAAPVWRAVMDYLHQQQGQLIHLPKRQTPAHLVKQLIRFEPAIEPNRSEWFIQGTQQSVMISNQENTTTSTGFVHIAYPGEGSIIALDPEIPPKQQRIVFKTTAPLPPQWQWQLDGLQIKSQAKVPQSKVEKITWFPMPGQHILHLINADKEVVDTVHFEVRGAFMKQTQTNQTQSRQSTINLKH